MKSVPSGRPLAIVVVGASGDLATRKIFPAIFALDARGGLPPDTHCFGFARSDLSDEAFRNRMAPGLRCEELADSACELHQNSFLPRCHYVQGAYDAAGDFARLRRGIATVCGPAVDVLYYFAIPPALFGPVAHSMRAAGILRAADDATGWDRVVLEKPFGHDRASSDALSAQLKECFREEQIYRIDHYLGKEVIQNLLVLRFANSAFEPLWNRDHVRQVHICWSEDIPLAGRAGYFDEAGIIRDVMQNHLTQMLALVAMECPWGLDARHIRDEKVRLLRQVDLRRRGGLRPVLVCPQQLPPEPPPVHAVRVPPRRRTQGRLEDLPEVPQDGRAGNGGLVRHERVQLGTDARPAEVRADEMQKVRQCHRPLRGRLFLWQRRLYLLRVLPFLTPGQKPPSTACGS